MFVFSRRDHHHRVVITTTIRVRCVLCTYSNINLVYTRARCIVVQDKRFCLLTCRHSHYDVVWPFGIIDCVYLSSLSTTIDKWLYFLVSTIAAQSKYTDWAILKRIFFKFVILTFLYALGNVIRTWHNSNGWVIGNIIAKLCLHICLIIDFCCWAGVFNIWFL